VPKNPEKLQRSGALHDASDAHDIALLSAPPVAHVRPPLQ
jgi:hypothetical protein